jgi:hypothetical protein
MEMLIYANNYIEKDYQTVVAIDWKNFDQQVKKRPEDYIFILSPDEWNKFMELCRQIYAATNGKGFAINQDEYINNYPGIFAIVELSLQPDFLKKYKMGHFSHKILGPSHAVFFINRSVNEVERSNVVLKRIRDCKADITRDNIKGN